MTKSVIPYALIDFIRCHSTGLLPISTIGLGRRLVSSASRVLRPPARITAFIEPAFAAARRGSRAAARRTTVFRSSREGFEAPIAERGSRGVRPLGSGARGRVKAAAEANRAPERSVPAVATATTAGATPPDGERRSRNDGEPREGGRPRDPPATDRVSARAARHGRRLRHPAAADRQRRLRTASHYMIAAGVLSGLLAAVFGAI